jgi:hypothetical protein
MKNKIFLLFLSFLLMSHLSFGSDKDSGKIKNYPFISIHIGDGIPFSYNKASEDIFESYGQAGFSININAAMPIKHSIFDITAMISYGSNPFNLNNYFRGVEGLTEFNSASENLNEYAGLPGISLSIPYHRFLFDFRLLGGVLYFGSSGDKYSSTTSYLQQVNPTSVVYYTSSADISPYNTTSLALDIGASVKFMGGKKIFIALSFDYFYAHPNIGFNATAQSYSSNTMPAYILYNITNTSYNNTTSMDVQLINLTFGIGYRFGK